MSFIKSQFGPRKTPEQDHEVDLALAVMCVVAKPGACYSRNIIAEVTGLGHGGPWAIEQRALKKLRTRLRYTSERELGKELA